MGFNKTLLPKLQDLQERFREDPDSVIRWLGKSDVFIGPAESQDFVKWIFEVYIEWDGDGDGDGDSPKFNQTT